MVRIIKFLPLHLKYLEIQEAQSYMAGFMDTPDYLDLLKMGDAYTVVNGHNIDACIGVFPMTATIGRGWAIMGKNSGRSLLAATREIKSFLSKTDYDRIETPVHEAFVNGHRWCQLLGFTNETPYGMKYYGFEGETYDLYAAYPREL